MDSVVVPAEIAKVVADRCHGTRTPGSAPTRYAMIYQAALLGADEAMKRLASAAADAGGDWVMVPRVPTPEMIDAAAEWDGASDALRRDGVWSAMLTAAPAPAADVEQLREAAAAERAAVVAWLNSYAAKNMAARESRKGTGLQHDIDLRARADSCRMHAMWIEMGKHLGGEQPEPVTYSDALAQRDALIEELQAALAPRDPAPEQPAESAKSPGDAGDWTDEHPDDCGCTLCRADAYIAAGLVPQSMRDAGGEGVREARLLMFLEILAAAGGRSDAGDWTGNWINAFCEDHEGRDPDTFNLAIKRGLTRSTHDTSFDTSTVWITDAGRAALQPAAPAERGSDHE